MEAVGFIETTRRRDRRGEWRQEARTMICKFVWIWITHLQASCCCCSCWCCCRCCCCWWWCFWCCCCCCCCCHFVFPVRGPDGNSDDSEAINVLSAERGRRYLGNCHRSLWSIIAARPHPRPPRPLHCHPVFLHGHLVQNMASPIHNRNHHVSIAGFWSPL